MQFNAHYFRGGMPYSPIVLQQILIHWLIAEKISVAFKLSWLSFSYKLAKIMSVYRCVSLWMLTRVEQIVTAAHRDL